MTWLAWVASALRTKLGQGVALALAVLGALGLAYRKGGSDTRAKRDAEDMANAYDREKTRAEIDRTTGGDDARDKLRDDWRRD